MTSTARVLTLAVLGGVLVPGLPAWAQTAPVAPPPVTTTPVEPLTPAQTAPPPLGRGSLTTADPYAATTGTAAWDEPPPPPPTPIYDEWWFWTGIGALAVIGVVVAVAASGEKTPTTYYGNGRAF